jgi:hypothetical protein
MVRDRLREPEARDLSLRIAAACPNHEAATAYIKDEVPKYIELTALDLQMSLTRPHERKWQQIVGNVVSHHKSVTSIFSKGYAIRTDDGIRVTDEGLAYLGGKGF